MHEIQQFTLKILTLWMVIRWRQSHWWWTVSSRRVAVTVFDVRPFTTKKLYVADMRTAFRREFSKSNWCNVWKQCWNCIRPQLSPVTQIGFSRNEPAIITTADVDAA